MSHTDTVITFDDLKLDPNRHEVWRGNHQIVLPGLSFRLLEVLVRRSPAPVSRRELVREVWGDVIVSDETVRQRVRLLRQALGNPAYVNTIKGIGYRLRTPALERTPSSPRRWPRVLALLLILLMSAMAGSVVLPDLYHQAVHLFKHR